MAEPNPNSSSSSSSIDPKSGFCSETKIFHSLRPPVPLPPLNTPLSVSEFSLSLLHKSPSSLDQTTAFIDSTTGKRTSFSDFLFQTQALASFLQNSVRLSKGDTAYILVPASAEIPIIYFSLLSLGVVVSPANPISTEDEISRQIGLTKPVIAFATSATAHKIPPLKHQTILIDSVDFRSIMSKPSGKVDRVVVDQSDTAAILYSSGTTGRVKGVVLTHRNFIALLAGLFEIRYVKDEKQQQVSLFTVPMFHVFGFIMIVRAVALAETVVLMERFDFVVMLRSIQDYRVTYMPVAPPIVVAMAKLEIVGNYDLSSLEVLACGGAPLGKEVTQKLIARLPHVYISQGYGMTESAGAGSKTVGPDEGEHYGSTGRLYENLEGKIVDPETGEALPPGRQGELWIRGPTVMKGYVGDDEATASTLDPEGWLKTGDLCYFDNEGYLFIVDRLKELIKYKGFQVPPAELEHLLQSHPAIADAAVIPYPDEEAGQIPMAYVVRKPGSNLTEAQVKDFIAKQVAPYKKIRRVAFINAIPKSPAGKILRRELIDISLTNRSSRL